MMSNIVPNQSQFIRQFNDKYREEFNPTLFERDEYEIVEALKKAILSCQRDKYFTIRVDSFEVIEDYNEINRILFEHEEEKLSSRKTQSKARKLENRYQYINMRDSDILLLIVNYYISINDGEENPSDTLRVILQIPRIVDKYYYRISGNLYSAIYQIVDGSTYNNSTAVSKVPTVTQKTVFMPIRLYRNTGEITDYAGKKVKHIVYNSRIFNKNIPIMSYLFAKFGLYGTIDFLGLKHISITDFYNGDENCYAFEKKGIFVEVPKEIFDNDIPTQCMIVSLLKSINKNSTITNIKTIDYWQELLSTQFASKSFVDKSYALALLDSLESIYDVDTYESLRLPEEDKSDIYAVIRWMIREFPSLRLKDNLDISTKRIRRADRIAAFYAIKVSKGIYRASDIKKKITIRDIKRYISVEPSFIINKITRDSLCIFRNVVNDTDAMVALKYSYKGLSGIGENGTSIPTRYRQVHYSHIGRVDMDASSSTDPGMTGVLCPLVKIYDQSFSEYEEPNEWESEFDDLIGRYRASLGRKELITFQQSLEEIFDIDKDVEELEALDLCIESQKTAIDTMITMMDNVEYYNGEEAEDGTVILYKK